MPALGSEQLRAISDQTPGGCEFAIGIHCRKRITQRQCCKLIAPRCKKW